MSISLERQYSSILVPEVFTSEAEFDQLFHLHCLKKQLLSELIDGEADFEEVLEALETFIGTSNMDGYLMDIERPLNQLCDRYGVPD